MPSHHFQYLLVMLHNVIHSLRNTMAEQTLSNIAILIIERETTNFVEENMMDIIIDEFAKKNDDRARLLCHKQSSFSLDPKKNSYTDCLCNIK